ncbi:YiiX/YebB-like N1pC/P60 family cysteine hydrolase [Pseudomonas sp. RIT357]|uniref:YiiX/YebB-like N1pC/P60 family cysteine hydrolase n=1 Tax=Pseudomonas sp. RIT357 TaxID=1470593 RepID=UPI00044EA6BC|nr:YiiX/YebB-like N1pC/P60 family cysteine hydrolase [Pseudomonas sp. RIT357]EZP68819.1 putative distant relative of cell wall-associated hydrolase [Pseudomonas sp. RIT357]
MKNKYLLDRKKLKKGDLILTAEPTKQSKGIRVVTLGRYSHAAIWVGGTMIEATLKGVFSKNAQRLLVDNPEHLAVYRSKVPLSQEITEKICEYAQSQVGSLYAISEAALMLPMRLLDLKESKKQFCSRLVACSYEYAGFDLQNLRNPNFCSPRQLSLCKAFQKVEGIVKEAQKSEIAFAQTTDPVTKNLGDTYEWLNKVRDLVSATPALCQAYDIQAQNDVSRLLLNHPEFDQTVTGFMRSTDYLTYFNHDRSTNPYRYDRLSMLKKIRQFPLNAGDFLEEELRKEPDSFNKFEKNIVATIHHLGLRRVDYFLEHLKLYRNLMNEGLVRMEVIAFGFDSIGETESADGVKKLANYARHYVKRADEVLSQ